MALAGKSPGIGGGGDRGREVAADAYVSRECECGVGMSEQRANHGWVEPDVEEQPAATWRRSWGCQTAEVGLRIGQPAFWAPRIQMR